MNAKHFSHGIAPNLSKAIKGYVSNRRVIAGGMTCGNKLVNKDDNYPQRRYLDNAATTWPKPSGLGSVAAGS